MPHMVNSKCLIIFIYQVTKKCLSIAEEAITPYDALNILNESMTNYLPKTITESNMNPASC